MRTAELNGTDAEHPASGKVVIDGNTIKLQDVSITAAPDARVILTKNFDEPSSVKIAALQGFTGSHDYPIPEGVNPDDYDGVVIWCDQFSVPIGKAGF